MKNANPDMLLRLAQADAFAHAVEYIDRRENQELYDEVDKFDRYSQHPTHLKLRPGEYTDDTQMSCAVAEVLIERGMDANADDFSRSFFRAFKRDPRDGYSRGFQKILERATSPEHMRQLIVPDSNRNGAAMRSVPLGCIPDVKRLMEIAGVQASVTHQTWGGINSSIAVALMSHFALYDNRSFASMYNFCAKRQPAFEWFKTSWDGLVSPKNDPKNLGIGMTTAHAVHTLLVEETSLSGIMKRLIAWGGDTDSVASIAWGIASCRRQVEAVPEFMERDLESYENSSFGASFLKSLSSQLMDAFRR